MDVNTVFVPASKSPVLGMTIQSATRARPVRGDVGIEIEMEGNKFYKDPDGLANIGWSYHKDGSLRGKDNAEYVLRAPIMFKDVSESVNNLWKIVSDFGTKLDDSNRTSVHVHLNCQNFHLNRLASFSALYFCFEEILTEYCGDHRVGNLFCLRGKDATGIVTKMRKFIQSDMRSELSEGLHYANFNAHALHKFGSIEIRSMRGPDNPQMVIDWVSILERIYTVSKDFEDPRAICDLFSQQGPLSFFETIMGDKAFLLMQNISFNQDQIRNSLYEGIRLAQDLCYCRDWDLFKPMNVKPDPFGRKMEKIAQQISAYEAPATTDYNMSVPSMNATNELLYQIITPTDYWNNTIVGTEGEVGDS